MLHLDTIWLLKYGFPMVRAYLLEDLLIFKFCPLEENASHHFPQVTKTCSSADLQIRDMGCHELLRELSLIPLLCSLRISSQSDLWILSSLGHSSCGWEGVRSTLLQGTWGTHPADDRGCEALSSRGPHMRTPETHRKSSKINDLENVPEHVLRLPKVSGITRDDIWHHDFIKLDCKKSVFSKCQDFHKIVADVTYQRSDSRAEVDTVGIYVQNHYGWCRKWFLRMRFDFWKWISEGSGLLAGRPSDFQIMSPGWKCFAPPHMRTRDIHQKSSKINDLENEPGHVWRLRKVSRVTRDDSWHHKTS